MTSTNIEPRPRRSSALFFRAGAGLLLPAAALFVAGCMAAPESETTGSEELLSDEVTGEDAAALNGSVVFPDSSCTSTEKTKLLQVAARAAEMVTTGAPAMSACLADAFLSPDMGISPEHILRILSQDMPSKMRCVQQTSCGADACAPIGIGHEEMEWRKATLASAGIDPLAALMIHEVAHNKGWTHFAGEESQYSVNDQVQQCAVSSDPLGRNRSDMLWETELAQVGEDGGQPFLLGCGAASAGSANFMVGATAGTGTLVRTLSLRCQNLDGDVSGTWTTTTAGSGVGVTSTTSYQCPSGKVVTGIQGKSGSVVDSLKVLCSSIDDVRNGISGYSNVGNLGGGAGGMSFHRQCPAGMAVQRIVGRAGDTIDQVRLVCQSVDEPARGNVIAGAAVGSTTGFKDRQYCTGFGAMVGLYGRSGGLVDRLGGICEPLAYNPSGPILLRSGLNEHITPAYGGAGGTPFSEECPYYYALVGFNVRTGAVVDRVEGICARIDKWKQPGVTLGPGDWHHLTPRGGNGGTAQTTQCPQGTFLAGLETVSDDNGPGGMVRGLRPLCRSLLPW